MVHGLVHNHEYAPRYCFNPHYWKDRGTVNADTDFFPQTGVAHTGLSMEAFLSTRMNCFGAGLCGLMFPTRRLCSSVALLTSISRVHESLLGALPVCLQHTEI